MYDYIVIGSGPSGLTCANEIINKGHTCMVIDRNSDPGGCHRVNRPDGYFSEHGPRIYSSAYRNFYRLLEVNGLNPDKYFTEYKFAITPSLTQKYAETTMGSIMHIFNSVELLYLTRCYMHSIINPPYYKSRSVLDVFKHFHTRSLSYLDKICRLTDGAGMDRYTAYEFLQLVNQNILYTIQEPTKPNDQGWVRDLILSLSGKGVKFHFSDNVLGISKHHEGPQRYTVTCEHSKHSAFNVVVATPTDTLAKLLTSNYWNGIDLSKYNSVSMYETYLPLTLHYHHKIKLKDVWGQGIGPWNIAWIVMSDYMTDTRTRGTLISCCISILDQPGTNGKTVHQCSMRELHKEVLQQLIPIISERPDKIITSPQVYRKDGKWYNSDTAFMLTPKNSMLEFPFKNQDENIYSVGTQNMKSCYSFTSAESAVQNALAWSQKYVPGASGTNIIHAWTLNYIMLLIIVLVIFIVIFIYGKNWPIITVLQRWLRWT